jgi:hypothetical protein
VRSHIFSVIGYVFATFGTQATSHFVVFPQHYAAVTFLKPEPVFVLGFFSAVIQGVILSYAFANSRFAGQSLLHAVRFAWLFGGFLVSYIALAETAKYNVPDGPSWIAIETGVGFVQYTLAGVFLGLAHRAARQRSSALTVG